MKKMTENYGLCPVCQKGQLHASVWTRVFEPHGKHIEVKLQRSVCDACGETTTKASQHKENLRVLAERKTQYGSVLMGEEILALRKRYGLTQQQASAIFGKGKIAFSRYESETSYPEDSTTLLLTLAIEKPAVIKYLADKAGVELPLWSERCEDEQRVKLRPMPAGHLESAICRQTMRTGFSSVKGHANGWLRDRPIRNMRRLVMTDASNECQLGLEAIAS